MAREYFPAVSRLQRQIERVFDDFAPIEVERAFTPPVDVSETESHFVYSFDLPGMSDKDVEIEVGDGLLRVKGERKEMETDESRRVTGERFYGFVERVISLPNNVKFDGAEAQFENGVLHIAIPKAETLKAKKVLIGKPEKMGILSKLLGKKEEKKEAA